MDWWLQKNDLFGRYSNDRKCDVGWQYWSSGRSYGMTYYGDSTWFIQTSGTILEWFMEPTTEDGHQKLQKEILEGDDLQGLLDLGDGQKIYWQFIIVLAVLTALGFLALFGGIGYKRFGKKTPKNTPKTSDRVKMIPLLLIHIPLFILIVFTVVLFSTSLWNANINVYKDPTNEWLESIEHQYTDLVKEGTCNYEVSVEGPADFVKQQILKLSSNVTGYLYNDEIPRYIESQMSNIRADEKSVFDLRIAASKLETQVNDLRKRKGVNFSKEFDEIVKLLNGAGKDLTTITKSFYSSEKYVRQITERVDSEREGLKKAVLAASEPFLYELDDFKSRVKVVMNSVHSAYRETADWINVVGKRNLKTIENLKQKGGFLAFTLFAQAVAAVSSILALTTLTAGFFALAVKIINPKALGVYFSGLTKTRTRVAQCIFVGVCMVVLFSGFIFGSSSTLAVLALIALAVGFLALAVKIGTGKIGNFISFVFFAQCLFVGMMAFLAGVGLYYSAHLNAACVPMYTIDDQKNHMEEFYKDIGIGTEFIDYNGTVHKRSFVNVINDKIISCPGGSYGSGCLLPKKDYSKLLPINEWFEAVKSVVKPNAIFGDFKVKYEEEIGKTLEQAKSKFREISELLLTHSTTSNLFLLVEDQVIEMQKNLQNLRFISLRENDWFKEARFKPDIRNTVVPTIDQGMETFNDRFNQLYSNKLEGAYMATGNQICLRFRTPAAGVWFAGTILSLVFLVSAVVMFTTARKLEGDSETEEVPVSVSTIYSPLIDDEKNPREQEN